MNFIIGPQISDCGSLQAFVAEKKLNKSDLMITNKSIIRSQININQLPCDVLFQEDYGKGEPNDELIDHMLQAAGGKNYQRIIAVGGGTVMDSSKLFIFGGGLTCEEIVEKGAVLPKKRKLILVPATCGTGSEVTNISVIEFKKKGTKTGLQIPQLYADEAVLIGSLLESIPFSVFAASSIDALIHSIESFVSPKASSFTRSFGRTAIERIISGYQEMVNKKELSLPANLQSFLEASCLAGIAFDNAGCAAVHALSYPIGAQYHVPHGKSNYLLFGNVYRKYSELGADLTPIENVLSALLKCSNKDVWEKLEQLIDQILPRDRLADLGIDNKTAKKMAASVIKNQQRLLANNPIALTEAQIYDIYKKSM